MPNNAEISARELALKQHIERLSPNLLRAYVLDMVDYASDVDIDRYVVAFHGQNAVPRKDGP